MPHEFLNSKYVFPYSLQHSREYVDVGCRKSMLQPLQRRVKHRLQLALYIVYTFPCALLFMVSFSNFSPNDSCSSCIILQTSAFLFVVMLNTMNKIVHTLAIVTTYTP